MPKTWLVGPEPLHVNRAGRSFLMKKNSRVKRFARFVMRGGRRRAGAAGPLKARPLLVMFDFDGTVADTFESGFEILNLLAGEFGFRPLDRGDLGRARDMRTRELMKFLGIPSTKLARISKRGTEEMHKRMCGILPCAGVPDILRNARALGFRLGILTSNSEENVAAFLRKHDLEIFEFVRCSSKLMGKARVIRSLLKKLGLRPAEVLFVGDETRDIDAAQETGVHMAAVAWGYNSLRSIKELAPDYLIGSPDELERLLKSFPAAVG